MRTLLSISVSRSLASALATLTLASCGSSTKPAAHAGPGGGAAVTITAARSADHDAWVFDDHGALPAISDDGSAVAALFHDEVDFVGSPVDTLIIWSLADGKELARVRIEGETPDAIVPDDQASALAAQATAALAAHGWLPVTGSAVAIDQEDGGSVVHLGDHALHLVAESGTLAMDGARLVPDSFPAPGTASEDLGGESGGCGAVTGLEVLAGGRAGDDWILLAPKVNLGGDSCFGELGADLARLVKITR